MQILDKIRALFHGKTHLAHAAAALAVYLPCALVSAVLPPPGAVTLHTLGAAAPLIWYWSRETRDAERRILAAHGGSVWTVWPRAMAAALASDDFLHPLAAIAGGVAARHIAAWIF